MSENELIAEFMGLPLTKKSRTFSGTGHDVEIPFMNWKYDKSWDWLMPVVEKIEESLLGQVEIHTAYTNINGEFNNKKYNQDSCFESQNDTKLDVTYRAVVKFIKWFQEQ